MNGEQLIKDLLKEGESEQLEFADVTRKDAAGRVICSFLNAKGGQLLIGITDKKELKGVSNAEKLQEELEEYLVKEIVPEAPISVSIEKSGNKNFILIKVWAGSKQPYVFGGTIYYRRGASTVQATSQEISALIQNRQQTEIHWERQPALGVELEDLDLDEIKKTMDAGMVDHKMKEPIKKPIDFLAYYNLFQNGHFTNACTILFAKKPFQFLSQATVRVAFLQQGKEGAHYFDDQLLEGNIFKNIDIIQQFFERHLPLTRNFDNSSWQRKDSFVYPIPALREGVMNALVHRDYSSFSSSASILLYADKLEITNSGKLPISLSELKTSHLSLPANPDIAHMVFLRGYIEKIGRGTLKILEACREADLKDPVWSVDSSSVKLSFFSKIKLTTPGENKTETLFYNVVEKIPKDVSEVVKKRLSKIIQIVKSNPGIKLKEMINQVDVAERTLKENLHVLTNADIVIYKGSKKTGGYFINNKQVKKLMK